MKHLYSVSVSRTDSWTYHIKADSEADAERVALADFRRKGGSGGEASVDDIEELEPGDIETVDFEVDSHA